MAGFLTALKARCEVVELDGGKDWRTASEGHEFTLKWYTEDPTGFEESWQKIIGDQKGESRARG